MVPESIDGGIATHGHATAQRPGATPRVDLTRWPVVGRFLRWRHARTAMQLPLLALAALMVFDGLVGPQLAPKNLATVGIWLEYRGLVVLALLLAGNLFCMACPFMLPRQLARRLRERFLGGGRAVPTRLANKWVALALVVAFFFLYELFDLWATPWWTAWVAVAYFGVAFLVDTFFRGAAFCKYVCPLGQFNFFGSLVSPLEVKVRDAGICASCRTKDCIRGTVAPAQKAPIALVPTPVAAPYVRGCELWLFQELKAGNQDCTFCLDCIHACPYDNVGVIGRVPLAELWHDRFRSGVGRFSQRSDLAALTTVFVFGAFLNAFAMIRPVYALQEAVRGAFATASDAPGLAILFLLALGVFPAVTLLAAGAAGRALGGRREASLGQTIRRYVYCLVPLGFGMWLAHYQFHFLTGGLTFVPVIQSFLQDTGLSAIAPIWGMGQIAADHILFPIEAALLYLGATGSIVVAFMIARSRHGDDRARVLGEALPWFVLILALLAIGLAILVQPMEMRGTLRMVGLPGVPG